jgi:lipid-A-disaccharide synthase
MKKILIVTGEVSADIYASFLVKELKKNIQDLKIYATGGQYLKSTEAEIIYPIEKMGVTGFTEVISKLPSFYKLYKKIKKLIIEKKIDLVVLIDYPGLNLKIAKFCKAKNIKVFYYIIPQVWAWGQKRIEKLEKYTDKLLVIFPFEKEIFKNKGNDCIYVGHPLVDKINNYQFDNNTLKRLDKIKGFKVSIIPGSRENEVRTILPYMVKVAILLKQKIKDVQFLLPISENIDIKIINPLMRPIKGYCSIFPGKIYESLTNSQFAIVTSGTATLETALFKVPMVVLYKTKKVTYLLAQKMVKIKNIALANIVLGKKVFPEFIQNEIIPEKIATTVLNILNNKQELKKIKSECEKIKKILGKYSSSKIVASIINPALCISPPFNRIELVD